MPVLARLRLAGQLTLTLSVLGLSAAATDSSGATTGTQATTVFEDPRAIALEAWNNYLTKIGWPKDMRDRIAPRFLGELRDSVDNEHGGKTVTFDGSRPGLRARVTLVLGADGKSVVPPVVELADVLEAR